MIDDDFALASASEVVVVAEIVAVVAEFASLGHVEAVTPS